MRGRQSSRSAAVVLAGCVGLAVMAPGLALAKPVSVYENEAACEAVTGNPWTNGVCDDGTTDTTTETGTGSTGTGAAGTGSAGAGSAGAGSTGRGSADTSSTETSSTTTSSGIVAGPDGGTTRGQTTGGGEQNTQGTQSVDPTTDPASAARPALATPATEQALAAGGDQLVQQLALLPGLDLGGLDGFVPGSGNIPLDLPFDIPTEVPDGGFTNPQEACAFLVSGLSATPAQLESLGEAFSGFCSALPEEFGLLDPTQLIQDLLDLLNGLIPSIPTPGQIPTTPPSNVPAEYWGYWNRGYDVDCPELTYDEANAILAWDRSDPFRLDRDNDGEACENNRRGDVEAVEYIGYPVGGVATGDGSTGPGASGVEVALAAGVLSGLGVTGLALVRRFARQG